ncbi:glutamyl-tRNA synthetase [Breoghania corrubedonensis]|uniref:Glutamate--tRNA ligase n=1 Tax=Breoghania corrubedonensis TaxID=665038 RepID=A0A2T5VBN2_9HYPH|nr:glutamate--tRNA ligase [Breoghania corrubedonensis]PTW61151.1 glutamyl-tRNA synthetase [Breoghania corrubedonensis]
MSEIVTRFAPSPTGFLHIGGARTALFNWLYARGRGGRMLLRIEDTDRERSTDAAITAILDGLKWLGLDWDSDWISQYERAERHREVARELVAAGKAYYCYATQEELTEMREKARAEGRPPRYDGRWRDRDASEAPEGVSPVVRIKAPHDGETVIDDEVQGRVSFPNKDLDDFILLRSDGNPTYMLAVVVDDHDMGVTHIIRGDDHLTNAARQALIYKAMGWDIPVMSHIPLIHGPDGAKLSKRHGALGVDAYRAMGYLPQAMRNYLVRLGWAHGDDEIMSDAQMLEWFDVTGIGKSAARFDFVKLEALNGQYMRSTDDADLHAALKAFLPYAEGGTAILKRLDEDVELDGKLLAAMPGLKDRAKTLAELADSAGYLWAERPIAPDEKAAKLLDEAGRAVLKGVLAKLETVSEWSVEATDSAVRAFAQDAEVKLGKVAQPLRAALTGRTTSPGIFDVLVVLGRDEALGRIKDQISTPS